MLRKRNVSTVAVQTSAGLQILDGDRRLILRDVESATAAAKLLEVVSRPASAAEVEALLASPEVAGIAEELLKAGVLDECDIPGPAAKTEESGILVTRLSMGAKTLLVARYRQLELRRFRAFAEACFAEGSIMLPAYGSGTERIAGPLVVPGHGACWNCARVRAIASSATPLEAWALDEALLELDFGMDSPGDWRTCEWLDEEIEKIVRADPTAIQAGQVRVQDIATGRITTHDVLPLPGCTVCGGPAVTFETGREARSLIDERFGIIRRVLYGTSDGETRMLPICARAMVSAHVDEKRGPRVMDDAFGKGLDIGGAFVSAVGEAVERYSACWVNPERLKRASYNELTDLAFHPQWLTLYRAEQYARPGFPYVPFDPDRPMNWVRGLYHSREVWVPAIAVFQPYACAENEAICQTTSNGLAAGTSVPDASRRALLELIERDAVLFSWYTRTPGQRILTSRTDSPEIAQMIDDVEALGASIELYRVGSGMPAHTVVCLGIGDGVTWPSITVGYGADPDIRAAARKAVLEHGQIGPYFRRVLRENRDPLPARREDVRTLDDHELYYLPPGRAAHFDFFRSAVAKATPLAEVPEPVGSLEDLDVAYVDVTSPDLAATSYRVVRAVGKHFLPVHSGYGFERVNNPRLSEISLNQDVSPIC